MNNFGIPENIWQTIIQTFQANNKLDYVYIFGSRARGDYSINSDIDLAVYGKNVSLKDELELMADMDSFYNGYKIDLINLNFVKTKPIYHSILRDGIVIYKRS